MSRTVLVLSATGTTGSATLSALTRAGTATARAASRNPAAASFPAGVQAVSFDLDDPATWAPALRGVDALYLALPPFRPDEFEVGAAVLAAAKAAGVTRIVKLSAMGVENDPSSGHRRLELAIEASGLAWIHLRPTFFMENFINFYGHGIRSDGAITLPAGQGRSGFVAAADIGEVAAAALLGDSSGEAWALTGPQSLDHDQVAAALSTVAGHPVRYIDISPEDHVAALRGYGMPETGVTTMSALYAMVKAGWTDAVSPEVERILGRPPVAFADWARDHAAAWAR